MSKRASNTSEYVLGGLIVCASCGKRFVGNAAHGNRYRYRYSTCFSRHRYGTKTCQADRLPADELEDAVLRALIGLYDRTDLWEQAAGTSWRQSQAERQRHETELGVVEAELTKAEQAIERYLFAFEASTLPEDQCGTRIRSLGAKIAELRDRRGELIAALERPAPQAPTENELAELRRELRDALETGTDTDRKTLMQKLVHDIHVEGRDHIKPTFKVPYASDTAQVRTLYGSVPAAVLWLRTSRTMSQDIPD